MGGAAPAGAALRALGYPLAKLETARAADQLAAVGRPNAGGALRLCRGRGTVSLALGNRDLFQVSEAAPVVRASDQPQRDRDPGDDLDGADRGGAAALVQAGDGPHRLLERDQILVRGAGAGLDGGATGDRPGTVARGARQLSERLGSQRPSGSRAARAWGAAGRSLSPGRAVEPPRSPARGRPPPVPPAAQGGARPPPRPLGPGKREVRREDR